MPRLMPYVAIWMGALLLLLWPAVVNQGPIWFFDTLAYLRAPDTAVAKLADIETGLLRATAEGGTTLGSNPAPGPNPAPGMDAAPAPLVGPGDTEVIAGRSIYYGAVLLAGLGLVGPFGVSVLQAGVFALSLVLALRAWLPGQPRAIAAITLATAGLTSAPFFANYLMPDFLTGVLVLAVMRLVVPPSPNWVERGIWTGLAAFAMISHTSHLIIGAGLVLVALVVLPLCRLRLPWLGLATVVASIGAAVVADMAFSVAIEKTYGRPPLRPPFLSARLIEDGTGYDYLRSHCPTDAGPDTPVPFELCRHMDRLPINSIDMIWADDPEIGLFRTVSSEARQRISAEQFSFAVAVVAAYPLAQAEASAKLVWEQLSRFGLSEFLYTDTLRQQLTTTLAAPLSEAVAQTRFYQGDFPLLWPDRLERGVALVSLGLVVVLTLWPAGATLPTARRRQLQALTLFVLLALLGNAVTTGILSAPFDRYQSRVIWLLTMLGGVLLASRWASGAPITAPTAKRRAAARLPQDLSDPNALATEASLRA